MPASYQPLHPSDAGGKTLLCSHVVLACCISECHKVILQPQAVWELITPSLSSPCADDADLLTWTKRDAPVIEHPPQGQALTGFRDPYIIQQRGKGRPWKIAIGSGINGQGGTILQYSSDELLQGAQFQVSR